MKQALQRYSEDRIGMVDYALESGGMSTCPTLVPAETRHLASAGWAQLEISRKSPPTTRFPMASQAGG